MWERDGHGEVEQQPEYEAKHATQVSKVHCANPLILFCEKQGLSLLVKTG
jgi:hypothetical protein